MTLADLAKSIKLLRAELVQSESTAFDLLGDEADCSAAIVRASEIRAKLEANLNLYFDTAEIDRLQRSAGETRIAVRGQLNRLRGMG